MKKTKDLKKKQINIYIEQDILSEYKEICSDTYINPQELIRGFIEFICSIKYNDDRIEFIRSIKSKKMVAPIFFTLWNQLSYITEYHFSDFEKMEADDEEQIITEAYYGGHSYPRYEYRYKDTKGYIPVKEKKENIKNSKNKHVKK